MIGSFMTDAVGLLIESITLFLCDRDLLSCRAKIDEWCLWECDGDCIACKYHAAGDTLSLDIPTEDGEVNMYDCIPDSSPSMENVIADRPLLDQLFNRLRELDPDADTIIQLLCLHQQ